MLPVALGAIFVRIGNFINSEIVGKVTESNLGVRFVQDKYNQYEIVQLTGIKDVQEAYSAVASQTQFAHLLEQVPFRHAAQLYEACAYLFVFLILMFVYWKTNKREQQGFLFGLFLVLLWTVRFFVERLKEAQVEGREDWVMGMNTGQVLSIPFIILGLYFMFVYKQKTR